MIDLPEAQMPKTQPVKINSDSAKINNILERQIDLLVDAGSEFAPELEIRYANGDFSLFAAKTLQSGSPLILIPDQCVPRITHFELSYTGSKIRINSCKPEATELQRQLLSLQLSIYNLSNKIERFSRLTPRFKLGPEHSLTLML